MNEILSTSDSLIGSLCREIDYLRERHSSIILSLENCRNIFLEGRLKSELNQLINRKNEISSACNKMMRGKNKIELSLLFLSELCDRPLSYSLST